MTQIVLLVGMDDEEYEESNQPVTKARETEEDGGEGRDDFDDEIGGINWVLTPQERIQIRKYRI